MDQFIADSRRDFAIQTEFERLSLELEHLLFGIGHVFQIETRIEPNVQFVIVPLGRLRLALLCKREGSESECEK